MAGYEAHACDHIAHRHVHRTLSLMLIVDDLVGGSFSGSEAFISTK